MQQTEVDYAGPPVARGAGRQPVFSPPLVALLACGAVVAAVTLAATIVARTAPASLLAKYWPFVVLAVGIGVVITLIAVAKLHAFLALVLAAMSAGLMALPGAFAIPAARPGEPPSTHWVAAIELTASEFGRTAGGIGIVIVLASIIGVCLLESGSADKIVRRFLAAFGERLAGFALLLAAYVVSIPIFFDTLFMLLVPIAIALYLRLRRDYMLFVMVICCAGVITHSMAIPHPGPLAMVEKLNATRQSLETGTAIIAGLVSGLGPLLVGWVVCNWINRATPVVPKTGGATADATSALDVPESALPSFLASVTPIILPVLLISTASFTKMLAFEYPRAFAWLTFIGERHVALVIGVVIAVAVLIRQKGLSFGRVTELMGPPLETAGVIILITAAGGAFGAMLRAAGVGKAIELATAGLGINLIVLSWLIAIVIRIAQGSATVAMLTTAAIVEPLMSKAIGTGGLPYHPLYLFMAIGYGAFGCSWMNDSGFWVVSRLGGLTERQTLRSWTVLLTVCSVAGLLMTWAAASVMPLKPAGAAPVPAATQPAAVAPATTTQPAATQPAGAAPSLTPDEAGPTLTTRPA